MIAVGTAATEGSDGYIEYKFNTELKPTPKMNDDGTVDFHTLENVNHIRKGEVVAVLHISHVLPAYIQASKGTAHIRYPVSLFQSADLRLSLSGSDLPHIPHHTSPQGHD